MQTHFKISTELHNLENLLPHSKEQLKILSLTIKDQIWNIFNEPVLATYLHYANELSEELYRINKDEWLIIKLYIEGLRECSDRYSSKSLDHIFDSAFVQITQVYIEKTVKEQWQRINKYYVHKVDVNEFGTKNIIEILDDFYSNLTPQSEGHFLRELQKLENMHFVRGRKGKWEKKSDLEPPSLKIVKENHIINRWNLPDKQFLYLSVHSDLHVAQETVLKELCVKENEKVTMAEFKINKRYEKKKIVVFDFSSITESQIFQRVETYKQEFLLEIEKKIKNSKRTTEQKIQIINKTIKKKQEDTFQESIVILGLFLLKTISNIVLQPLGNDINGARKEEAYNSFHQLAAYFEQKGYGGILYTSTQMKKTGKQGTNIVLFDSESAELQEETIKTVTGTNNGDQL